MTYLVGALSWLIGYRVFYTGRRHEWRTVIVASTITVLTWLALS